MYFGKYAGFFTGPFESPHGDVEWFILANANARHTLMSSFNLVSAATAGPGNIAMIPLEVETKDDPRST